MSIPVTSEPKTLLRLIWHAIAVATVFLVPFIFSTYSSRSLTVEVILAAAIIAAGYPALVIVASLAERGRSRADSATLVIAAVIIFASCWVATKIAGLAVAGESILIQIVVAGSLFALYRSQFNLRPFLLLLPVAAMTAVSVLAIAIDIRRQAAFLWRADAVENTYLSTMLYKVKATAIKRVVPPAAMDAGGMHGPDKWWGGALAQYGDRFLLATGDGRLFNFDWGDDEQTLGFVELKLRVPINSTEFIASAIPGVDLKTFRVSDLLVVDTDDGFRIYTAHHVWNSSENCSVLRVSQVDVTPAELEGNGANPDWQTIFETEPCLPFKDRAVKFGGLQNGGKMALLDADTLILTVGDHEFDGYYAEKSLPQSLDNTYGKTIRISLSTGEHDIFSLGHRNPQGLHIDAGGQIWSTEHGPKGGDELNLLHENGNYGWPLVSHGTAYDKTSWPPSEDKRRHEGFLQPTFAWVPSIGTSNLTRAAGPEFSLWKDDLLVASLTDRSLWRLRLVDGRVVYAERMRIGCRIRDILQSPDGRLILWCDNANRLIFLSEPHADDDGELLFAQCEACHSIDMREQPGLGPDLRGIGGRRIAAKNGFWYSDALRQLGGQKWTRDRLEAFLKSPQDFAPGTSMQFPGITDERQRQAIVEYLLSVDSATQ